MRLRGWRGWGALVLFVCSRAITATALANTSPQTLISDTMQTTPGGATFTAPAGWSVARDGPRLVLSGPEPELRLAIVETKATTADAAVAEAWPALRPDMKRPLKITQPVPGRYGWDEQRVFNYETSPNERVVVYAMAYRRGNEWTVLAVESSEPAFERRASQVGLVTDSLRPPGYVRESFAGKKAHPLDATRLKQITDFIEQSLKQTDTPGAAISLVQNGKVVFAGGFAVRELGKKERVDANTLFIIIPRPRRVSRRATRTRRLARSRWSLAARPASLTSASGRARSHPVRTMTVPSRSSRSIPASPASNSLWGTATVAAHWCCATFSTSTCSPNNRDLMPSTQSILAWLKFGLECVTASCWCKAITFV